MIFRLPMNKVISAVLLAMTIALGCNKDKENNPNPADTGYKIEITRGNQQTDTLGKALADSVIVKVTKDGMLLRNVYVHFETSGCDRNQLAEAWVAFRPGEARYQWRLNGAPGKQILKIVLLDSLRARVDSVLAEATAIKPEHGWHRSSCTPEGDPGAHSFCRLSSGRLIASFHTFDYPFYSDDNAVTWHPLTTFPLGSAYMEVTKLAATSSDEIFAATENNGLYYSSNGGQTWTLRNTGITDPRYFVDMAYTPSGKLIYTTYSGGVYLSEDKGLSWKSVMTGLSYNDRFYYPVEQPNGDLYVVNDIGEVYRSSNKGQQWTRLPLIFTSNAQALYVDKNGHLYISVSNSAAEIYRSLDNGASFSKIYTAPNLPGLYPEIHDIKQGDDGTFYFNYYGSGLISTANFSTFNHIDISEDPGDRAFNYITDKNGNLVVGSYFNGIYYNLP